MSSDFRSIMTLDNVLKGIILAGGKGLRLERNTTVTNKHLVRVGRYPMIEYPLATLRKMGITDITIVTGTEHVGAITSYLTAAYPKIDFTYKVQKDAGGIAQALALAENVVQGNKMAVILGDNVFEDNFSSYAKQFIDGVSGSMFFVKAVPDPYRFGVAETSDGNIISIEEKPKNPKSNFAVTGLYFYDPTVFDKIKLLTPSARGEYEITDVNNMYVKERRTVCTSVNGFWSDAGTLESITHCDEWLKISGFDPLISEISGGKNRLLRGKF